MPRRDVHVLFYALVVDAAIGSAGLDSSRLLRPKRVSKCFNTWRARNSFIRSTWAGRDGHARAVSDTGSLQLIRKRVPDLVRRRMYFRQRGVDSPRSAGDAVECRHWRGNFFSKSLRGVMSYKLEFAGLEGWFNGRCAARAGRLSSLTVMIQTVPFLNAFPLRSPLRPRRVAYEK